MANTTVSLKKVNFANSPSPPKNGTAKYLREEADLSDTVSKCTQQSFEITINFITIIIILCHCGISSILLSPPTNVPTYQLSDIVNVVI